MKKIIVGFMLFVFAISNVFAFDATLSTNTTNVNINNPIQLTLKLAIDQNVQVKIKQIKGLENFDVVGQRQFQSSSSQVTIINGQTKSINTTIYNVVLSLSAKKAGNYTIGPAILEVGNKEYKTNTVNVKISGAKIMLNNTQNYQPPQTQQNQVHNPVGGVRTIQQNTSQSKIQNFENEVKKIQPQDNSKIYLIIAWLIFIGLIILIRVYNNYKKEKNIDVIKEEEGEIQVIEQGEKQNKIDFEQQPLDYPSIDDEDFENKLDKVFRQKLVQKFNISNIYNKTYTEILEDLNQDNEIKEIINGLELLKYSNLVTDREKLLELVKSL